MTGRFPLRKILYYSVLAILSTMILLNLRILARHIVFKQVILDGSVDFPGRAFLPLRPYLANVRFAGYYSDRISKGDIDLDHSFAYVFQRAKFALAPTTLDHFHPWDHEYVIAYLYYPATSVKLLERLPVRVIGHVNGNIWLLRRDKI